MAVFSTRTPPSGLIPKGGTARMFHIAKPFQLRHCPGPSRSVAKSAIMRLTCTLALVSLIASCAPKAIVVEDEPEPIKPAVVKNTTPEPAALDSVPVPPPEKRALMKIDPGMTTRLPERRDFQPTAPTQATADRGPNLMVPAPKPQPSE
jgi:hypothetical protein